MNQEPSLQLKRMPKWLEFVLTKRFPCALMVVFMLTSAYWFNVLFGNIPLIGFLMLLVGMVLHLAVPSVFALVLFGGGLVFSLQVGGIAALLILLLSSGSMYAVLVFLALFAVVPVMTGLTMQQRGLGQASWLLAVSLLVTVFVALMIAMDSEGLKEYVSQLFKPLFNSMVAEIPVGEKEALSSIRQLQNIMVEIFPGLLVISVWLAWWGDILFARKIAKGYGFYQGDESTMLSLVLPKKLVYVLLAFAAIANMTDGDIQYVAVNGLLVLAGLMAVQGISVAHTWLKSRGMMNTIVVMYMMLFFWSVMVLAFVMIGLLDIWFNFRRNIVSTTGEK